MTRNCAICTIMLSITIILFSHLATGPAFTQTNQPSGGDKLTSKEIELEGSMLDKQFFAVNKDIIKTVKDYKVTSDEFKKHLRIIPFQTDIKFSDNGKGQFIEVSRHKFIRNPLNLHQIVGIKNKTFRIYYSGETVTRIEMTIFERYYDDNTAVQVDIVDPTPGDEQTNDITFTHTLLVNYSMENEKLRRTVKLLDNKKLGEIQNTTAFPIRNQLRRDVLVPNIIYVNNVLLDVAESFYKGKKDAEALMLEFLQKSTAY
ncbi:MAG: hypothetical protein N2316_07510 [Spirochaetes bacterium]|nr:hypothetical protein [Spirochaetota bacterium]